MSSRMNDYIFETKLGKGSFGSVYLVRRKRDSKPFVVKEQHLNPENALSFKIVEAEVRSLKKTRHPNIVGYHGAWMENDRSYIFMEYATRCTLKDLLDARELPLKEQDALYLFSQIVLGVRHIHFQKILHRDLKPENIMLTGSRGDIVKIGDFGVSKNLREWKELLTRCKAGSYYYMAPEMLVGEAYDFKCDIWSMGVILYQMVMQDLPYPATSLEEIIRTIKNDRPQPLPEESSPAVVNLVSKMLRKDPARRPKSEQLVLCPYIVPLVARVHINLGRTLNPLDRLENYGAEAFLKFLKLCNATAS